jgi:hypothetical protein
MYFALCEPCVRRCPVAEMFYDRGNLHEFINIPIQLAPLGKVVGTQVCREYAYLFAETVSSALTQLTLLVVCLGLVRRPRHSVRVFPRSLSTSSSLARRISRTKRTTASMYDAGIS